RATSERRGMVVELSATAEELGWQYGMILLGLNIFCEKDYSFWNLHNCLTSVIDLYCMNPLTFQNKFLFGTEGQTNTYPATKPSSSTERIPLAFHLSFLTHGSFPSLYFFFNFLLSDKL
ncbi:hypothetical protein ACJX0J_030632, partial [Zea mays]